MADRLDKIRADIDALDATLRELLRTRLELVAQVAAAKADAGGIKLPIRPAREAKQMRVLAAYAQAHNVPLAALIAIWRELIGMALAQEGEFIIHAVPESEDLARAHFGSVLGRALDVRTDQIDTTETIPYVSVVPLNMVADKNEPVLGILPVLGTPQAALCGVVAQEILDEPVTLIVGKTSDILPPDGIMLGHDLALLVGAVDAPQGCRQLGIFEAPLVMPAPVIGDTA